MIEITSVIEFYLALISAPDSKNFSLTAGVSSVLAQLELSCGEEDYFRAFNLDITCPAHLPIVTSCNCLTKTAEGDLISKNKGLITYQVDFEI